MKVSVLFCFFMGSLAGMGHATLPLPTLVQYASASWHYTGLYDQACSAEVDDRLWALDRLSYLVDYDRASHDIVFKVLKQLECVVQYTPLLRSKVFFLMSRLLAHDTSDVVVDLAKKYLHKLVGENDYEVFMSGLTVVRCLARIRLADACDNIKACSRNPNVQCKIAAICFLEDIARNKTWHRSLIPAGSVYLHDQDEDVRYAAMHFFDILLGYFDNMQINKIVADFIREKKYKTLTPYTERQRIVLAASLIRRSCYYSSLGWGLAQALVSTDSDMVRCEAITLLQEIIVGGEGARYCEKIGHLIRYFLRQPKPCSIAVQQALLQLLTIMSVVRPEYGGQMHDIFERLSAGV